ncbi:MAG: SRPBCC family protein [Bacteroidetes bacterium]|nr:SRPBCC family protein [Bacteroidota bacterium]
MKFLKYFLYFILLITILFFGMGFVKPEVTYESEITVEKPIEEVWAIVSDQSRVTEWLKEIKRMDLKTGKVNTVGAVTNIYMDQNGEEMMMQETITARKKHEYIAMSFTMDFMNMDYEMIFTEKGDKTHIQTKSKTKGNGLFARSILAFMTSSMKNQEDINMENLKNLINKNQKNYFPE